MPVPQSAARHVRTPAHPTAPTQESHHSLVCPRSLTRSLCDEHSVGQAAIAYATATATATASDLAYVLLCVSISAAISGVLAQSTAVLPYFYAHSETAACSDCR